MWSLHDQPPVTTDIIRSIMQDRGYVVKEGKSLQATSRGRVLSAFLQHYFARYVDYDFTSNLESQLDEVAGTMSQGEQTLCMNVWHQAVTG